LISPEVLATESGARSAKQRSCDSGDVRKDERKEIKRLRSRHLISPEVLTTESGARSAKQRSCDSGDVRQDERKENKRLRSRHLKQISAFWLYADSPESRLL